MRCLLSDPAGASVMERESPGRIGFSSTSRTSGSGLRCQYGLNVPPVNPRKPLDELVDRSAILQILEKGGNGHPGTAEHPRPADNLGPLLDRSAPLPCLHADNPPSSV